MPGRKRYVVPSLQSLTFMVSYRNIFKKLGRCPVNAEEEKPDDDKVSMPEDQPFYDASLNGTISYIRARLSQHLVGTMSDDIRYTFIPLKIIQILTCISIL